MCICMFVSYMWSRVHLPVCEHVEAEVEAMCFPLYFSILIVLRQCLSLNQLARPACQWAPGTSQHWGYKSVLPHLAFYLDAGDLNSGPNACAASTLPTKSFLQLLKGSLTRAQHKCHYTNRWLGSLHDSAIIALWASPEMLMATRRCQLGQRSGMYQEPIHSSASAPVNPQYPCTPIKTDRKSGN